MATNESKDHRRLKEALAGTQAKPDAPALIPWQPTKHQAKPKTHQTPTPRGPGGRFAGKK
jgi:hypothetical protein